MQRRRFLVWTISLFAGGFGLLTVKEGGTVLFGGEAARTAAGDYVPFVLWFNFVAGFAYIIAGAGLWLQRPWAAWLAVAIAAATTAVFAALGVHIYSGGVYEMRTVIAMSIRTLVWATISAIAWRVPPHRKALKPGSSSK
jgi:uncharacterized membrane protein (DUF2068 family)